MKIVDFSAPARSAVTATGRCGPCSLAQIEALQALRAEAGEAGDLAQVAICDRAIAGELAARIECAAVLSHAAAQS